MQEVLSRLEAVEQELSSLRNRTRRHRRALIRWKSFACLLAFALVASFPPQMSQAAGGGTAPALVTRVARLEAAMFGTSPVSVGATDRITIVNSSLNAEITARQALASQLHLDEQDIAESNAKLVPFSIALHNPLDPSKGYEVYLDHANLNIRNGLSRTETTNEVGNLIIGYNADRPMDDPRPQVRTGSHNLILGDKNNYLRFGGIVAGSYNEIGAATSGDYASILGGYGNQAWGNGSVVSGGCCNLACGTDSAVSGGSTNKAVSLYTSVSGGTLNQAGVPGDVDGANASVSGGLQNQASGFIASVSGGYQNVAGGVTATSICGGYANATTDRYTCVSGGAHNAATYGYSSISGGEYNNAYGLGSSISGGANRSAASTYLWLAGALSAGP